MRQRHSPASGVALVAAALVVGSTAALTGCSQVAAIAPVGGGTLSEIRYAANDVLVSAGIDVLTAPVCTSSDTAVSCIGETTDNAQISVTTTSSDLSMISVKVGDSTLYSGSVNDVLDAASRPTT